MRSDKRKEIDAAKKEKDGLRAEMDRIIQIRKVSLHQQVKIRLFPGVYAFNRT